jgi:hypothetical protein
MTMTHHTHISLISLLIVALLAPTASSKQRRKKKQKAPAEVVQASSIRLELIDTGLLSVPFGQPFAEVMTWIDGRVSQTYEPRFATALDARERDALNHRMRQEVAELRKKVVSFDGKTTGFEASVVQGEFEVNAGEELLLFRDGNIDHYLFFSDGVLWKYARPLRATDSFATRVSQWTADQGTPSATPSAGDGFANVQWLGLDYAVRVDDRRLVSASDLLVIEWRKAHPAVQARRAAAREAAAKSQGESDLDSYLE